MKDIRIVRGSTSEFKWDFSKTRYKISDITNVELYISNLDDTIKKPMSSLDIDVDNNAIFCTLSQEETLLFVPESSISVSLVIMFGDKRRETTPVCYPVKDTVKDEVMDSNA